MFPFWCAGNGRLQAVHLVYIQRHKTHTHQTHPTPTSSVTLNLFSKATNFCLMLGCCGTGQREEERTWWGEMKEWREGGRKRRRRP